MYPHVTFFKMCEILSAARNFRRYIENTKGIRDFNDTNAKTTLNDFPFITLFIKKMEDLLSDTPFIADYKKLENKIIQYFDADIRTTCDIKKHILPVETAFINLLCVISKVYDDHLYLAIITPINLLH